MVVVVEDDELTGELLGGFLESMGARISLFDQPADFLTAMAGTSSRPDIFIFDLTLPGTPAYQLIRHVKSHPFLRLVPVLVLTARDDADGKAAALEAGADEYMHKPFTSLDLYLRLRALLRLKELHEGMEEIDHVLQTLVTIVEAKDAYTKGHSLRVAELGRALGRQLNLPEEDIEILYRAGLLHDIGKIIVDTGCLNKPGPLTPQERQVICQHPEVGACILSQMDRTKPLVPLVGNHHERLDGSGYPAGKKAADIPFFARILSVADVYDALTSDRPYRPALPRERALAIIGEEVDKGWWDPEAYRLLVKVLGG